MFNNNQRQWDELNAFAASFVNPGPNQQHHSHGQQQQQHHQDSNQHSFQQPQSQPPQHHQFSQPQYQQQPQQQPQQHQYGYNHPSQFPRYGATPSSAPSTAAPDFTHSPAIKREFGIESTEDMDWTASSPYENTFHQNDFSSGQQGNDLGTNHQFDNLNPVYGSEGGGNSGPSRGVGRLVAHFENKNFGPPLPPRPTSISSTTPIAINQQHQQNQQQSHQQPHQQQQPHSPYGQFDTSPQANSFVSNSYASGSFTSNRFTTPSDSNFGSFGTAQSPVTSPIATSPPPISYGSYHEATRVTSPVAAPSADPFGSMDFMASSRIRHSIANRPIASTAPNTPAGTVPGGTPGFAIWRAPGQQPEQQQQVTQQYQQHLPQQSGQGFQHVQLQRSQPQRGHTLQSPTSAPFSNSTTPGGYFRPPVPSTPKPIVNTVNQNQFILELNPGLKAKPKAPVKPPKPRAPKPASGSFSTMIKEEPSSPHPSDIPSSSVNVPARDSESATPRPATASRPSREQVPAEAWEGFKSTIRDLYLEQRKPLKEVMSIMAEKYSFTATPKMYKTRFSQWGFVKNNTEDEVKRLLSMKFQRDAEGKVSEFVRNGKIVNLGTYLKRKGVTEYDLVDFELPADLPSHVRCRTPTPPPAPEYLKSPDLLRAQELVVGNMRKAFLQCRQVELEMERHIGWSSIMVWGAPSSELLTEANFFLEAGDHAQGGQALMKAFNQLEVDLQQLSPQGIIEVMLGMVQRDVGLMTALCKYVAAFSTTNTNYERSHPLRQIFTCLYEVQQKHGAATLSELLWGSTPLIADELEAIYGHRHPYVARMWIDLALIYNHKTPERLEKSVLELRILHRQMEQHQEAEMADLLSLRCAIAQMLYAADPESDAAKQAANDLWRDMNKMKLVFRVRDSRPNIYCYHCPVRVDPWTKRCRRRYDSEVELLEKHVGVKVHTYFEEDCVHTMHHEMDSQDAWTAAVGQQMSSNRWGYI